MDDKEFIINDFGSMNSDKLKTIEKEKNNKKYYYIIGGVISVIIISIIIIIILLFSLSGSTPTSDKKLNIVIGTINCTFEINTISSKISIFGNEFKKESDFDIYIDDKKLNYYSKEYLFDKIGLHTINIELFEDINMNYMFKDINNLISLEMNSENNGKILSMESTFENCNSLTSINITGFNTEKLYSLKKLFYNSDISNINLDIELNNVQDMSYMFAGSNINIDNLSKLNLTSNNLKNVSYMFYNCLSLTRFTFSIIDLSKV